MSDLSVKGEVKEILEGQSGTSKAGKEWNKRDFVIETDDQYPKLICFTLFGDKTDLLSNVKVGDIVNVGFNVESREYNGRYFHNINAWRIDVEESNEASNEQVPEPEAEGDLPF